MRQEEKVEYFKAVNQNIKEFGCHITTVLEDKETTPFGYSTGLYANFQIPELFISGLPSGLTTELINNYSNRYRSTKIPVLKIVNNLTDRFPIYLSKIDISKLQNYVLSSVHYYEKNQFEYLQLIYPDLNGYLPGQENYDYDQEIFGEILHI